MIIRLLIASIILVTISCKKTETLKENEKVRIIKEIRVTLDNYYSDIKKSGLSAEYKYFDNSSNFFWIPPGYSNPISYESFASILKEYSPSSKSIDNTIDSLRIIPLSNVLASYYARIHSTMIDTEGNAETFHLIESGIWTKKKDGWKLLSGQTTALNSK